MSTTTRAFPEVIEKPSSTSPESLRNVGIGSCVSGFTHASGSLSVDAFFYGDTKVEAHEGTKFDAIKARGFDADGNRQEVTLYVPKGTDITQSA